MYVLASWAKALLLGPESIDDGGGCVALLFFKASLQEFRHLLFFFSKWKHLNYHVGSSDGGTHLNLPNDFTFCLTVYRGRIIFLFNI
jgi:hypothetical protein